MTLNAEGMTIATSAQLQITALMSELAGTIAPKHPKRMSVVSISSYLYQSHITNRLINKASVVIDAHHSMSTASVYRLLKQMATDGWIVNPDAACIGVSPSFIKVYETYCLDLIDLINKTSKKSGVMSAQGDLFT